MLELLNDLIDAAPLDLADIADLLPATDNEED